MLHFPLTFNPHHIIFDPLFFTHKITYFLYFLSHSLFSSFFFFLIFSFAIALKHLFLSSFRAAASSPSQWWQWWLRFGFGLMGFLLKVWFWVLSCWVFHWRFDFGFRLIFGLIFLCFWLILWLEYHGLWWVVMGCGGGDWVVVGQC